MTLPDAAHVEEYTEEEMKQLLDLFEKDKAALTKNQKAAVARYNFKKGKGEPVVYKGQAATVPPAPPTAPGAPSPAPAGAGVSVPADVLARLPPDIQALANKDPATLTKDEKIALAKAKSQAVKAMQAEKDAAGAPKEEGPKGPTPEEVARQKALEFPHAQRLQEKLGDAIEAWSMQVHAPYATVKADRLLDAMVHLRDELGFTYLRNLTAADYHPSHFEVVYNLTHMERRAHVALRVKLPREASEGQDLPSLPSVTPLFKGADWLEREVFDLFGIRFLGHPYMRRLMLPDGWTGHPLRKDYDISKEQFIGLAADGSDIVSFRSEDGW